MFGDGGVRDRVMLIGEQPGDSEDLAGTPFVGPAGRLLDEALEAGGIPRDEAYVTNVVKHFKFTRRGKRRIHDKPNRYEVEACKPWLGRELEVVAPDIVVLLGATAAQALLGSAFRVTKERGIERDRARAAHVRHRAPGLGAARARRRAPHASARNAVRRPAHDRRVLSPRPHDGPGCWS